MHERHRDRIEIVEDRFRLCLVFWSSAFEFCQPSFKENSLCAELIVGDEFFYLHADQLL
jgi:hypothetical protein